MPQPPFAITAEDPKELINQIQLLMGELYEERIGGAITGDVFSIDDSDILTLALADEAGIEKSSNKLQIKLDGTTLTLGEDGLKVTAALIITSLTLSGALAAASAVLTGALSVQGNSTLGNASTDLVTCTGRLSPRTVAADPTGVNTAGTRGEIVYCSANDSWYGKTVATASDQNWAKLDN